MSASDRIKDAIEIAVLPQKRIAQRAVGGVVRCRIKVMKERNAESALVPVTSRCT